MCCDGECKQPTCSINADSVEACAGATVVMPVTGNCWPSCWSMGLQVVVQPLHATITVTGGSIPCLGLNRSTTIQIAIAPDAPPGPFTFVLSGTSPSGFTCSTTWTVTVAPMIDLEFGSVTEADEEDPGGFLCLNDDDDDDNSTPDKDDTGSTPGEDDLELLTLTADGTLEGTLTLRAVSGGSRVKVYENADRSSPVSLPMS